MIGPLSETCAVDVKQLLRDSDGTWFTWLRLLEEK